MAQMRTRDGGGANGDVAAQLLQARVANPGHGEEEGEKREARAPAATDAEPAYR